MRIVLAEDEALLREGLVMLLERAGHDVVASVATATELVHVVKRGDPTAPLDAPLDMVITDVRMPPGRTDDGLRAAIELRRARPHLPILLLSQYLGNEYLQRLLDSAEDDPRSGGAGYLLKDRVSHVHEFMQALQTVASGGVVVDRKVISALMRRREDRLERLTPREREVLQHVSRRGTCPTGRSSSTSAPSSTSWACPSARATGGSSPCWPSSSIPDPDRLRSRLAPTPIGGARQSPESVVGFSPPRSGTQAHCARGCTGLTWGHETDPGR